MSKEQVTICKCNRCKKEIIVDEFGQEEDTIFGMSYCTMIKLQKKEIKREWYQMDSIDLCKTCRIAFGKFLNGGKVE